MDDIMGKLNELLSDEESMRQITELAQMMSEGKSENERSDGSASPDMSKIAGLAGILGSVNTEDRNTELLAALKPHLKPERQVRADKAIKFLHMISLLNAAKESGMLNEIL